MTAHEIFNNNIFVVSVYGNLKEQIVSELKNRNAKMILE